VEDAAIGHPWLVVLGLATLATVAWLADTTRPPDSTPGRPAQVACSSSPSTSDTASRTKPGIPASPSRR
jgi:hypothetical protein